MLTVSQQFKDAIYSPSRQTAAKVIFQIVDIDAAEDATTSVTSEASISKKAQVTNTLTEKTGKFATFETDYWKLDGSFVLPPKPTETGYEVGWWSNDICPETGIFVTPQVTTLQFTKDHSSIGLTIFFDVLADEYASDFTIVAYDSLSAVIHTETVTGNTRAKYILERTLQNFRKIIVTVTKWAKGNRRARISEISLGVVYDYTGNELINVNVIEEIDTMGNQLASNEVKFTLDNSDKRFNILNPTGVYPALQRKQKVTPLLGAVDPSGAIEYAPMGIYYLTKWNSDEGTLTASFTARDILDILAQSDFAGGTYTTTSLYDIAVAVLTSAGVTNYSIDTALRSIASSGSLAKMKHREALQLIAIAGQSVVYSDRAGKLIIKQLTSTVLGETISFDNMPKSPQIKLDTLINTIYIKSGATTYTYTDPAKPAEEQILSIEINNTLVSDATMASNVSAWILAELKKRFLYEINWRMNPALECGDIVTVQDDFATNKTVRITKQEFSFAGYLGGKTNGRGGGV